MAHESSQIWPRLRPALYALATVLAASCGATKALLPGEKAAEQQATAIQQLQVSVMRFADEYAARVGEETRRLQQRTESPEQRLAGQNWALSQATSAYTIASGPSAITNALDIVVLATLSRMVSEDHWVGEVYGTEAAPLRDIHRHLEAEAWALLNGVLTPEQLDQVHEVIDIWRGQNPEVRAVAYVHFRDFAKATGRRPEEQNKPGNIFSMLGLDPLASLDPAAREIEQTRQLAERAIYYVQRAPTLLDMQIERLTYQLAAMPETRSVLADAGRFSHAAESAGQLAENFPELVAREREAAIHQVMTSLVGEQAQLREIVVQIQGALQAGTATSDSLRDTIRSLDTFVARFDRPPAPADAPPKAPFDIRPYGDAMRELGSTARELQSLITQLDTSGAGVDRLAASTAVSLRSVVDHAFWRLIELVLITVVAVFGAAVGYRMITRRSSG